MKIRLIPAALSFISIILCMGCDKTCSELKEKLAGKIEEVKRACDCNFSIECDKEFPGAGAVGLTGTGPDGRPLIKLPGGEQKVEDEVLKHELVHAIDRCAGFSDSKFQVPEDVIGTRAEYIFLVRRRLLAEFIAYKCVGKFEDVPTDENKFPNPDDIDPAILSAYSSLASTVVSTLPADVRDELMTTLEAVNLSPRQIRSSREEYRALRRQLEADAQEFKQDKAACLKLVQSLKS